MDSREMRFWRNALAAGLLSLSFPVFAQQAVRVPVPQARIGAVIEPAIAVQGDLYGSGAKGVILIHGGGRTKESWRPQAAGFADAGFVVLAINFRGDTVDEEGRAISVGSDEENAADIRAAAGYLRTRGVKSVSAVGASMGGYALADADARSNPGEFDRIVLLASSAGKAAALKGRKLFIVAREDARQTGPRLPEITNSYQKAPQPKELVILEGSAHAQNLFDTDQGPRLMSEILRFLRQP
jgi:dienelactone hydrolase